MCSSDLKTRTIPGCVVASLGVVVGMWLERFLIIVPALTHKYLAYTWGHYTPQLPEILIFVSTFGAMILFYVVFSKVVPIISIWEMKIGQHPQLAREHETTDEKATLWRTHP